MYANRASNHLTNLIDYFHFRLSMLVREFTLTYNIHTSNQLLLVKRYINQFYCFKNNTKQQQLYVYVTLTN